MREKRCGICLYFSPLKIVGSEELKNWKSVIKFDKGDGWCDGFDTHRPLKNRYDKAKYRCGRFKYRTEVRKKLRNDKLLVLKEYRKGVA